jgi:hypothetical protein
MITKIKEIRILFVALLSLFMAWQQVEAQRMNHGTPQRSASRPSGGSNRSINGGSVKSPGRQVANPSVQNRPVSKENTGNRTTVQNKNNGNRTQVQNNNAGKKADVGNKTNVGNKVSVDNSKKNVNVNIDNSKNVNVRNNNNTVVRHNNYRPYTRPPYVYGGHRYYCHHPYYYHPYHAFYWGPLWHPWGFFIATLATTAIIVSIENQQYHYDQGVYYIASDGGYTVVQAPVGATITTLPPASQTVVVNETTNNYYYGGAYYEKSGDGYTVVPPTAGTVVENLPEGGEEVKIGDVTYVKFGETYYQPIQKDGKDVYEVVQIEEGEK